jgi:sugar lactone lactonase YvrE
MDFFRQYFFSPMNAYPVELLLDAQNSVGESPVWSAKEQALYWVDIPLKTIHRLTLKDHELTSWVCPEMTACIAPDFEQGHWIVGAESGVYQFKPESKDHFTWEKLANVKHQEPSMRFNDGRLDRQGRFLAGTMVNDMSLASAAGAVYTLNKWHQNWQLNQCLFGFITPNGMAFSPKGDVMYLSDSHPKVQKIWSFEYDIDSGKIGAQSLFFDMLSVPGRPDGAAVDTDGCYWICGNDAGLVYRLTPDGRIDQTLTLPVKKPAMCSFGGERMDTLFVTSIRPSGIDLSDQPLAGGVFAIQTPYQGMAEVNHLSY